MQGEDPHPDPGTIVTLVNRRYLAKIGTRGAALRQLVWGAEDLVVPSTPELSLQAFSGRILAPWPNRLRSGEYTWNGVDYRVPVTEAATGTALHGLLCWMDFEIEAVSTPGVVLRAVLDHPGYPTTLEFRVTYVLHEDRGLSAAVTATNTGDVTAPYGVAAHPYLTCGGGLVDECTLTVPAARVLTTDERKLPLAVGDVTGDEDLRTAAPFGPRRIDSAYTGLPDEWEVRLARAGGPAVVIAGSSPWVQVYSGEEVGRAGVAVEPMTCPPDAFNSGDGLIVLEPGQAHTLRFEIRREDVVPGVP